MCSKKLWGCFSTDKGERDDNEKLSGFSTSDVLVLVLVLVYKYKILTFFLSLLLLLFFFSLHHTLLSKGKGEGI